jgi:ribulose-5-phosphate 4-epimerase/fuculose-1-phosphate aldolase
MPGTDVDTAAHPMTTLDDPGHTEATLREDICRVGRSLYERGYVHATAGNISVRLPDGFLITPTDACLGRLEPSRLARLDAQGVQTAGCTGGSTTPTLRHAA